MNTSEDFDPYENSTPETKRQFNMIGAGITFIIVLLIILAVLYSRPVHAQSSRLYHTLEVSYIGLNTLDVITTCKAINSGGYETNPLMKEITSSVPLFITTKVAATALELHLLRTIRKENPKLAFILLSGMNVGMSYVVYHNYQVTLNLRL